MKPENALPMRQLNNTILLLVLIFCGCASSNQPKEDTKDSTQTTQGVVTEKKPLLREYISGKWKVVFIDTYDNQRIEGDSIGYMLIENDIIKVFHEDKLSWLDTLKIESVDEDSLGIDIRTVRKAYEGNISFPKGGAIYIKNYASHRPTYFLRKDPPLDSNLIGSHLFVNFNQTDTLK